MDRNILKLIYYLANNCRKSSKELGRLSRKSQQSASYLISTLVYKKHIQDYQIIIDPAKFGLINIIVTYNYEKIESGLAAKVKKMISQYSLCTRIETVSQGADIIVNYIVPNLSLFNKQHRQILHDLKGQLKVSDIFVVIVKHLYDKKYLVTRPLYDDIVVCGDRESILPDIKQRKVLQELYKEPRAPILSIAKKCELDSKTVVKIKSQLEKQQVIKGYTANINVQNLGFTREIILLNLEYLSVSELDKFVEYCSRHKNLVELTKVLGNYELMLTTEQMIPKSVINDIRKEFKVSNYKILQSETVIKNTYIPYTILQEK